MSREEAAMAYLNRLLGFYTNFQVFQSAAEALSENELLLLDHAVSRCDCAGRCVDHEKERTFLGVHNENDYQI